MRVSWNENVLLFSKNGVQNRYLGPNVKNEYKLYSCMHSFRCALCHLFAVIWRKVSKV